MLDLNAPPNEDAWYWDGQSASISDTSTEIIGLSTLLSLEGATSSHLEETYMPGEYISDVHATAFEDSADPILQGGSNRGSTSSHLEETYMPGEYISVVNATAFEDSADPILQGGSNTCQANNKRPYKALTGDERQQIYALLLELSSHSKLKRDNTTLVAQTLNLKKDAVQRVWRRVKECRANGLPINVSSRKKGRCGCKKKDIDLNRISSVPLDQRSTLRALTDSLGVAKTTLYRRFKEGLLRRHSSTLNPSGTRNS